MFTIQEVASKFKITPRTVRRWVALGIFPRPIKIAGTVRFRPEDVEQFVASGWLDDRPGRPAGFASGWLPEQTDVAPDELATANDLDTHLTECAKTAKDFFEKQGMTADAQADGK